MIKNVHSARASISDMYFAPMNSAIASLSKMFSSALQFLSSPSAKSDRVFWRYFIGDEEHLDLDGVVNTQNYQIWETERLEAIMEKL